MARTLQQLFDLTGHVALVTGGSRDHYRQMFRNLLQAALG